jgi:phosphoglycolate phosphatase (TIGR01487 family)
MARAVRANVRLRAVVTDIDGTLTNAERRLDPTAVAWTRRLERHGIPVLLATGNVLPIALAIHRSLGLSGPIVAENGGIVYRRENGRDLIEKLADRAIAVRGYRALVRAGLPVRRLFTDRWRETEVALEPTVPVREIRQALRRARVPVSSIGTGFAVHLMEPGAGKLPALRRALEPLGLTPADCVVLGDGDNDATMLRAAGFGVSFASGSRAARLSADYVTTNEYGEGFVEGLKASGILRRQSSSPGGN